MKYIVFQHEWSKYPQAIVFSARLQHCDVAMGLFDSLTLESPNILGAGFCRLSPVVVAYGESGTLNVKSRGHKDSIVIARMCRLPCYNDLDTIR